MTTLKTHAKSSRTALGYPPEWVVGLAQRIGEEVPFGPSLELTSVDVERLLKCVGLWKSERLLAITSPLPVEGRFTRLTRSLVRRWGIAPSSWAAAPLRRSGAPPASDAGGRRKPGWRESRPR